MKRTKLLEPFLILLAFLAGFIWLINSLNTGNPLWFLPIQPVYQPTRVLIYHYGETVELRPGDEGFAELDAALTEVLSSFQNTDLVSIGLGEATLQDYYQREFVVEAYYGQELRFNLPVRLGGANMLLFPIDGRHDERNYVFLGRNREYLAGALQVADRQPLDEALAILGFERQP